MATHSKATTALVQIILAEIHRKSLAVKRHEEKGEYPTVVGFHRQSCIIDNEMSMSRRNEEAALSERTILLARVSPRIVPGYINQAPLD